MQYSLYINQLFVANHPECDDLDIIDIAIFDCVRKLIAANWGEKKLMDGILWANIRVSKIIQEMPLLRNGKGSVFKPRAIHNRIAKLCDAGLLQKWGDNQTTSSSFIALGALAAEYDSYTHPLHLNANPIASTCKPPLQEDAIYKNTIQNTLSNNTSPTPSNTVSPGEPETKTKRVRKARLTRSDVLSFYENEKRKSLETPLPKDLDAAAAAWRIPGEEVMKKLAAGYSEVVDFMLEPSDMWPQGMWRCVLTKPDQLEFLQFCRLVLQFGMTRAEIKENLTSWENKKYDNDNLYATLYTWKIKPRKQSYGEAMPPSGQARTGLSIPKQVRQ